MPSTTSLDLPNPIVTMYHNITPEHFFEDPVARRYCRLGRDQLGLLARRSLFGLADSNYNRTEMLAAGFRRVDVIPVRVDYSEFELRRDWSPGRRRRTGCSSGGWRPTSASTC